MFENMGSLVTCSISVFLKDCNIKIKKMVWNPVNVNDLIDYLLVNEWINVSIVLFFAFQIRYKKIC